MANGKHTYKIDLNLSQQSKAVLKDLKASGDNINELNEKLNNYAQHGIKAGDEYCKALNDQADALQKQIDLQEQLQAEIVADKRLTEQQKKEALKRNREETKALKNKQKELQTRVKVYQVTQKVYKEDSLGLKLMSSKIKAQEKLNQLLGKESKLRQGINKTAGAGLKKAGGLAAKGGAAIGLGSVGAMVGAAVGDVDSIAEKERALRALKVDPSLADEVFLSTRAGYTQIVDTLNKLSGKFSDKGDLVAAAITDIRFPGAADMYLANTSMGEVTAQNMQSVLEQIQKSSGAQDLTAAMQASLKASSVTYGDLTRDNYIQAYAALQGIGIDEKQINEIIKRVANKGGDFVENFNAYMQKGAGLHGQSSISAQTVSLDKLDYSIKDREKSDAEKLQEAMARMQKTREEISMQLLPVIAKVMEELKSSGFFDRLGGIIKNFADFLDEIGKKGFFGAMKDLFTDAFNLIWGKITTWFNTTLNNIKQWINDKLPRWGRKKDDDEKESTGNAQGGLVTSPSLVGEMGPELVLPLNNPGRMSNIMNNYHNQNVFNINGNAGVSALSLSQSISNNRFIKTSSRVF